MGWEQKDDRERLREIYIVFSMALCEIEMRLLENDPDAALQTIEKYKKKKRDFELSVTNGTEEAWL